MMQSRSLSFCKSARLLKAADFRKVLDEAHQNGSSRRIYHSGPFSLYIGIESLGRARLGLSVPKRVLRDSVDRNRVKRCVREFFRHHASNFSTDVVIKLSRKPETLGPTLHKALEGFLRDFGSRS